MSPYAITKLKAEKFLKKKYYDKSWILRLAPVYSDGFSMNIDRRTKMKSFFYRVGNGNTKLSLCNIENINFVSKAITNDNVPSGTYIISDHSAYTYNDLLMSLFCQCQDQLKLTLVSLLSQMPLFVLY